MITHAFIVTFNQDDDACFLTSEESVQNIMKEHGSDSQYSYICPFSMTLDQEVNNYFEDRKTGET